MPEDRTALPPEPAAPSGLAARPVDRARYVSWVMRIVFASGLVALVAAASYAASVDAEAWFRAAIYQSCLYVGIGVVVCWAGSEVLLLVIRGLAVRVWLATVSLSAVWMAWLYVFPAALYGRDVADFQTWHLLPLFAVMQTAFIVVVVAVGSGLLVGLVAMAAGLRRGG